jgi:hypothetical protein
MQLTEQLAKKVLEAVDQGLVHGLGEPIPGQMCIEAAVCFAMGMPHNDKPSCVGSAVRDFKIGLNDSDWSSDQARAKGLRKLAIAQLGSDQIDQQKFTELLLLKTIQQLAPLLFREMAKKASADDAAKLEAHAVACAGATELQQGVEVLSAALQLASALDLDLARARALALARALDLDLALALDRALARALALALDLARARALALALDLARARARALDLDRALDLARAYDLAYDEALALLANIGLECLKELGSPGCQWLGLCEDPNR